MFPARAAREGPLPFSDFLEWALYDEEIGFYSVGGQAGRRSGDFITSPEVGMLYGAVLARAIDGWWRELGEPDPFVVVEAGAGPGTLARTLLAAAPACAPALRLVLVERSARQRELHGAHLPLEQAAMAFGPEDDDSERPQPTGRGPLVVSLAGLPRTAGPCVVVANELLDNLAFDVWERRGETWWEVRVAADLVEVVVPSEPPAWLASIEAEDGARVPVQGAAGAWLRDALEVARVHDGGRVVVVDYAATTAELATRQWLRTYRGHTRGGDPLAAPGTQDITADVCIDQLAHVRTPASVRTQAEWLRAHGIDDIVAEGRAAEGDDLAALKLRSRIVEADALLDPAGLGAFHVLEWSR